MDYAPTNAEIAERLKTFQAVAPNFGKILPAAFFQNTSRFISSVTRVHNLASGIFKPKDSVYALCITSMMSSRYHDKIHYNANRTWWMYYSPKSGGMDHAA